MQLPIRETALHGLPETSYIRAALGVSDRGVCAYHRDRTLDVTTTVERLTTTAGDAPRQLVDITVEVSCGLCAAQGVDEQREKRSVVADPPVWADVGLDWYANVRTYQWDISNLTAKATLARNARLLERADH